MRCGPPSPRDLIAFVNRCVWVRAAVVSEETGQISLVAGEGISENLDGAALRERLLALTGHTPPDPADVARGEPGVETVSVSSVGSETP